MSSSLGHLSRRDVLHRGSLGFGSLALAGLLDQESAAAVDPHFAPKAKHVIFLYMDGGVSHVDSFDPKPLLKKENGQKPKFEVEATVFNNNGNILASPWDFKNYGKSGIPISDLFPHIGSCSDELCVMRSMTAFFPSHPNANYFLHSGLILAGRPSMGAWASYGLGSANTDLPTYVVVHGGQVPSGGLQMTGEGFLPAAHGPSVLHPKGVVLQNINPQEKQAGLQEDKLALLRQIDGKLQEQRPDSALIASAVKNYEMAYRMQMAVPEVTDIAKESEAIKELYGLNSKFDNTRTSGAQCLMIRRLFEKGVRFVELTITTGNGDRWDQHGGLKKGHSQNALAVDQPIAALIKDLESRGLLDSTLIVFAGEFGRTPFAQGRDHNPQGFSIWMAGGGIKGGTIYGANDEYGYHAIENKMTVHDMHANMLHLMGVDHKKLTYRCGGRDVRLTDVHGEIIPEILA